jgi:imidazole glycerol-phosphate synthase subunit HisH
MRRLRESGLGASILELALAGGRPVLGICLGMQLLAESGAEGGDVSGLGLLPGHVVRFRNGNPSTRIPHVGWNTVSFVRPSLLFSGLRSGGDFYFVHSYHFVPAVEDVTLAVSPYVDGFVSAVGRENVFGVQFHPEKSQRLGLRLIGNFLSHADSC